MKLQEFRKLIREEVRKTLLEATTLDPNKKLYWFEYYPHQYGTLKAEVAITGKTLLQLKKLYDSNEKGAFDKVLNAASKNKTFYFDQEVFGEFWTKLSKSLAANKPYARSVEEGSFAISPNSMAEAKKMVKKIEAKHAEDELDF